MESSNGVWNDVELVTALFLSSPSIQDVLLKLGLSLSSTNYKEARKFATKHNLSVSNTDKLKFEYGENPKGKFRVLTEDIFVEHSPYSGGIVKRRLLESGLLEYKCYGVICQSNQLSLLQWDNLSLQLEHKNGIADDNRIENLEFLCPNCHSLTPTFGGGNTVKYESRAAGVCKECNRRSRQEICSLCSPPKRKLSTVSIETILNDISVRGMNVVAQHYDMSVRDLVDNLRKRQEKINRIMPEKDTKYHKKVDYGDLDELVQQLSASSFLAVSRKLGVSDNGLRKHLKKELGQDHPIFKRKGR